LWAALRTSMATTQPTITSLFSDFGHGQCQRATLTGPLTGISSVGPCTILAESGANHGPDLRITNS
jgi:hypothetical protein